MAASARSSQGDSSELFVPGRVCLFGEHSDWVGSMRRFNSELQPGACIVAGTDQGIYARYAPHGSELILHSTTVDGSQSSLAIPMDETKLRQQAEKGGFFSYACGVAYHIVRSYDVGGIEITNYKTTLPHAKGLSSSAAICVLVARAFNRAYDLKMSARGEMELGYLGEILTPSRCGRMDQCVAFGRAPVKMSFDGDLCEAAPISVAKPVYMLVVDLGSSKDTTAILQGLGQSFPFPKSELDLGLAQLLGSENQNIIARAVTALMNGDGSLLGDLMVEAQAKFDKHAAPLCPEQLKAPWLHELLDHAPLQRFIYGGKGVGSQGDGTAQLVCRSAADAIAARKEIEAAFPQMTCWPLTLGSMQESEASTAASPLPVTEASTVASPLPAAPPAVSNENGPQLAVCESWKDLADQFWTLKVQDQEAFLQAVTSG